MTGVTFNLETRGLDEALRALTGAAQAVRAQRAQLADAIGATLESATRRRIADEKTAPEGAAWPGWSEAYGATRKVGQTLLRGKGDLMDAIAALSTPDEVRVGTNLVYGAIHQFGGSEVGKPGLPARPFLGVSARDESDLKRLATEFLSGALK